jgi:hypothetical protein
MESGRPRPRFGWWLLAYALLALAVFAGYRWVKDGPPRWLVALFRTSSTRKMTTRRTTAATQRAQ